MRITPQQIKMQLQEMMQADKGQIQVKVGQAIMGKVLAIQTEAIMIQLDDGSNLRALVEQPERFVEGEMVKFQVKENEAGALPKLEIMSEKTQAGVKQMLSQVDIQPTEENIKAYEVLKSLDLSISKSNIETLTNNLKFIASFNKSMDPVLLPEVKTSEFIPETVKPEIIAKLAEKLSFESPEAFKEAPLKEVVIKMLDLPQPEKQAVVEKLPKEIVKEVFGLIREASSEINTEDTLNKLGQLLKLNKPLTFKNIGILDKLTFESGKISEQIKELTTVLPEKSAPKLLALLKGFDIKSFETKDGVKMYFDELMTELKATHDTSASSRVKQSVEQLMESIQFLERDQEDISWLQMPIQMNQQLKNVDVYLKHDKKTGKKMTKDNAKILVALNTDYLDLVQAVIQVNNKKLNIQFNVQHESVKKLIEAHKSTLADFFDVYDTTIKVENKSKMSLSEFVEEDNAHYINVKV